MNVCEGTQRFQVDTGSLLLPDFHSKAERVIERFSLAFLCYNAFNSAEFVLRTPAPTLMGQVMHYSRIVSMPARHELFCIILDGNM